MLIQKKLLSTFLDQYFVQTRGGRDERSLKISSVMLGQS